MKDHGKDGGFGLLLVCCVCSLSKSVAMTKKG